MGICDGVPFLVSLLKSKPSSADIEDCILQMSSDNQCFHFDRCQSQHLNYNTKNTEKGR